MENKDKNKESLNRITTEILKDNPKRKIKFHDNQLLNINGTKIEVSVLEIIEPKEKDDNKPEINELKILFKTKDGYVIVAEVNKENEIIINEQEIKKAGITDKIKLNDEENEIKLEENEEKNKEKEDEEKEDKEQAEEEKPDLEKDSDKEEMAKKHNVDSRQVIHISNNEKVTEDKRFAGLAKWAEGYDDIYVIPEKDNTSWKTIGIKNGEEEEIESQENKQIGGKNPTVTIKKIDGEKITQINRPLAMYEIDNEQAYAIVRDEAGRTQMLYCRQEGGDKKTFWGITVPEAEGKNVLQKNPKEREFISSRNNSGRDLSKKAEQLEEAENFDKRGAPSKEKGVQTYEIDGTPEQNRQLRKEEIKNDLYKRKGLAEKMKGAMPGYAEYMDKQLNKESEDILKLMEENDKLSYEDAIKQVEGKSEKENEEEFRTME